MASATAGAWAGMAWEWAVTVVLEEDMELAALADLEAATVMEEVSQELKQLQERGRLL